MSANKKLRIQAVGIGLEATKLARAAAHLESELVMSSPSHKVLKERIDDVVDIAQGLSGTTYDLQHEIAEKFAK